jgi:hypothetical protein
VSVVLFGCGSGTEPDDVDDGPVILDAAMELDGDSVDAQGVVSVILTGVANALVDFSVAWTDPSAAGVPATLDQYSVVTNPTHATVVSVTMGTVPGEGVIVASVGPLGLADSLYFEIVPGAVSRVSMSPGPALFIDSLYALEVVAVDRHGNPVPDTEPILAGHADALEVDESAGTLRATSLSADFIVWRAGPVLTNLDLVPTPRGALVYARTSQDSFGGRHSELRVANLDGSDSRTITGLAWAEDLPDGVHPTWSPDGSRVAYFDSSSVMVRDIASGARLVVVTGVSPHPRPSWTSDGEWIYYVRDDVSETWRVRSDGSDDEFVVNGLGRVSPNGQQIALVDDGLWLYDLGTEAKTRVSDAGMPTWSPDGSFMLAPNASGPAGLRWEVYESDGTLRSTYSVPAGGSRRASISADGKSAIIENWTAFSGTFLWILDLESGTWRRLLQFPTPNLSEPDVRAALLP